MQIECGGRERVGRCLAIGNKVGWAAVPAYAYIASLELTTGEPPRKDSFMTYLAFKSQQDRMRTYNTEKAWCFLFGPTVDARPCLEQCSKTEPLRHVSVL